MPVTGDAPQLTVFVISKCVPGAQQVVFPGLMQGEGADQCGVRCRNNDATRLCAHPLEPLSDFRSVSRRFWNKTGYSNSTVLNSAGRMISSTSQSSE